MSSGENSVFEEIINVGTQISTGGLVGFDKGRSGSGFTTGAASDVAIEGLKEVTGANAAEEANKQARERFEQEQANALQDRENARTQNATNQLAASRQAGAVRSSGRRSATNFNSSNLGSDERDFLGL